jgi:hypothetical protein
MNAEVIAAMKHSHALVNAEAVMDRNRWNERREIH